MGEDDALVEVDKVVFFSSSSVFSEHSDSDSELRGCENHMRKPIRLRKLAKKSICDVLNMEKPWKNPTNTLSDFSTIDDGGTADF